MCSKFQANAIKGNLFTMALVQVIPLGGANEIGRNCTALIQDNDMIIVDVGLSFPNEEMHGVEIIIPDFSYIIENKKKLRGIFLTHGHEDHIGAISYLLQEVNCPVYGTDFTLGMVRNKLAEKMDLKRVKLIPVKAHQKIDVGSLSVEFIRVTHSIPENSSLSVWTKHGIVLFTGDFKFDYTPVDGKLSDVDRFKELAEEGVLLLLSDSTNVDRPGWGPSESSVLEGFLKIFREAKGRVLVTCFASNMHRIQQAFDAAEATGRKVAIAGRRMEMTVDMCIRMGYMNVNPVTRLDIEKAASHPPEKTIIMTTGSQGEPLSALVKMSKKNYSRLRIRKGDTILYSARPIPGNEGAIWRTINRLFSMGAEVIYEYSTPIHASGHAYQEEIKMMINLTRPYYIAPIHGEPRHQFHYTKMVEEMGYPNKRVFCLKDGHPLCLSEKTAWIDDPVQSGEIYIDKAGGRGISNKVLRERNNLADYGVITVQLLVNKKSFQPLSKPKVESRGFSGGQDILDDIAAELTYVFSNLHPGEIDFKSSLSHYASDTVSKFIQKQYGYKPIIVAQVYEM
jgi:ribonuclease J